MRTGIIVDSRQQKFASMVNGDSNNSGNANTKIYAELTADITLNAGEVSTCDGINKGNWKEWIPIGKESKNFYQGIFDGNGYTISGLYINGSNDNVGMFGFIGTSVIKNLGITNSYVCGNERVGGLVGFGRNSYSTITHCFVDDITVKGQTKVGEVAGYYVGKIQSCYASGSIKDASIAGGIVGGLEEQGIIDNTYFNQDMYTGEVVGSKSSGSIINQASGKASAAFWSGEVAYLLNTSKAEGERIWYQNLSGADADAAPVLQGGKMVYVLNCQKADQSIKTFYGNEKQTVTLPEATDGYVWVDKTGKELSNQTKYTFGASDAQISEKKIILNTPIPNEVIPAPEVGTKLKDAKGASYKVTTAGALNGTVEYAAPKNKSQKSVSIPATVTLDGINYQVTSIAAGAFKNNKKLTKVTIGSNIKKIGKQAFYGCKKLKSITIKTAKLTKKNVGSKAFKGIYAKATIKVPKKQLSSYKKILKVKGVSASTKIKK